MTKCKQTINTCVIELLAHCSFHIHSAGTEYPDSSCLVHIWPERTHEYLNRLKKESQLYSSLCLLNLGTIAAFSFSCIAGYGLSVLLTSFQNHALCHAGKDKPNSVGHIRFVLCDIGIAHHARLTAELPWKQISQPHSDSMV